MNKKILKIISMLNWSAIIMIVGTLLGSTSIFSPEIDSLILGCLSETAMEKITKEWE